MKSTQKLVSKMILTLLTLSVILSFQSCKGMTYQASENTEVVSYEKAPEFKEISYSFKANSAVSTYSKTLILRDNILNLGEPTVEYRDSHCHIKTTIPLKQLDQVSNLITGSFVSVNRRGSEGSAQMVLKTTTLEGQLQEFNLGIPFKHKQLELSQSREIMERLEIIQQELLRDFPCRAL